MDGFFRDLASCRSAAGPSSSGVSGGDRTPTAGDASGNQSVNGNGGGAAGGAALHGSAAGVAKSSIGGGDDGSSERESAPLDEGLLRISDEQLARARDSAAKAAGLLLLTDAVLLFPPGQIALAAMRTAFRKVHNPCCCCVASQMQACTP